MLSTGLNFIGLALITVGSICAARATPAPQYNADGSVSLSSEPDLQKRLAIHRRQKHFGHFLWFISAGAALQAVALFVS